MAEILADRRNTALLQFMNGVITYSEVRKMYVQTGMGQMQASREILDAVSPELQSKIYQSEFIG